MADYVHRLQNVWTRLSSRFPQRWKSSGGDRLWIDAVTGLLRSESVFRLTSQLAIEN